MSAALTVSTDPAHLDREWIWRMLSSEAYWATWRARADVEAQIESAWRVVGIYDADSGAQVGFARAVSDGVAFAYLADVIVDPSRRGDGVGKRIVEAMIDDGPGADFRWTLFTRDAHGLYEQYGFEVPDETAMVRPAAKPASS
jgi:GNAT superfamily N-acetyltransferase